MLTREQALNANEFHFENCTRIVGPRGGITENIIRYRRNGQTQTWKTRTTEFRIPVVHGLKGYGQIWSHNAAAFHTAEDCLLRLRCCSCVTDRSHNCFCSCHTLAVK